MSTKRIQLVVAYDGTDFCGWAAQTGQRSVQGTLTEAVRRISGENLEIVSASRTDSGAHARGQVCHFDTEVPIPPRGWNIALNQLMPRDLTVVAVRSRSQRFHSRFCARDREYVYALSTGPRDPFRDRFAYWHPRQLDVPRMAAAASQLKGKHDFRAFTAQLDDSVLNTVREIFDLQVTGGTREVKIRIVGTAFLRGMMRRMAGALFEVGLQRRNPQTIAQLLQDPNSAKLPEVLPARGLTLIKVRYSSPLKDNREKNSFCHNDLDSE